MLNLQSLFNTCENQLIGLINPQNCIGFHKVAALHTVTSLQKKAEKVMLNKLGDFVASQEFKEMEAAEVIKHIQDAALKVGDEWVWVISKFNGTSTPKGSYSAKTGLNCQVTSWKKSSNEQCNAHYGPRPAKVAG